MNKIKRIVPVVILIILSVGILFSINSHGVIINPDTSSSQIENEKSFDDDSDKATSENMNDIDWENDYELSHDITGEIVAGFENDVVIYLNEQLLDSRLYDENIGYNKPGFMTIGHIHNGEYTLGDASLHGKITEDETNDYIVTRNRIFTEKDNTYNVYLKDYYDNSSTGYRQEETSILLRTNADWNVTPWKVKYINYDIDDNVEINQTWIDEISVILDKETGGTDTPAIIRESWSFEYNGKTVNFVNASNIWDVADDGVIETYSDNIDELYEYNDADIIYSISATIVDNTIISYGTHTGILYTKNRSVSDDKKREIYYIFQTDNQGNMVAVPFYMWPSYGRSIQVLRGRSLSNISFIGDLDNDGNVDVISSDTGELTRGYNHTVFTKKFEELDMGEIYSPGTVYSCEYPLFYYVH